MPRASRMGPPRGLLQSFQRPVVVWGAFFVGIWLWLSHGFSHSNVDAGDPTFASDEVARLEFTLIGSNVERAMIGDQLVSPGRQVRFGGTDWRVKSIRHGEAIIQRQGGDESRTLRIDRSEPR